MEFATLTAKNQITLPKAVRQYLRVQKGDLIVFEHGPDGRLSVLCQGTRASMADVAGKLKPKGPLVSADQESVTAMEAFKSAWK